MTRRRWIADEVSGDTAALTGAHAAHLRRVLRARVGQEFDIAVDGAVRVGRVTSIGDDRVEFALGAVVAARASADVTLVLAVFKFDRMEWAIEKCTEIGVSRIVPVIARRTDAHLASAAGKRRERWERIARQAAEQSRRAGAPEIGAVVGVREIAGGAAPALPPAAVRVVLSEGERAASLRAVIGEHLGPVVLAVGPEGGWTDTELHWFREARWVSASLGETILRAETAAIVGCALVMDFVTHSA